jgi:hypothetical protein
MTRDVDPRDIAQRGLLRRAKLDGMAAARMEGAAGRPRGQRRRRSFDRRQARGLAIDLRQRGEQAARIGMARPIEDVLDRPALDDAAGIHDGDPVGGAGDDAEVVADKNQAHAMSRLQSPQQFDDLRLHRDIQSCRRLVGNQQFRLISHGHGDHCPLPHATRQLVWVLQRPPLRVWDGDELQHVDGPARGDASGHRGIVDADRLGDLGADGEDRIQGRHRILKDHADAGAAQLGKLLLRPPG